MNNKTINLDFPTVEELIEALKNYPPKAQIIFENSNPTGILLTYEKDDREYDGKPVNLENVNLEWYDPSPLD